MGGRGGRGTPSTSSTVPAPSQHPLPTVPGSASRRGNGGTFAHLRGPVARGKDLKRSQGSVAKGGSVAVWGGV